jgi:hypothetical protein
MTIFSSTASPGQRWKMFLPGAGSIQHNILGVSTATALIRSLSDASARQRQPQKITGSHQRNVLAFDLARTAPKNA